MSRYVVRRLLLIPLLLLGITALDFGFINLAPGDPVTVMIDPLKRTAMSPVDVERRREALGLNEPLPVRYVIWLNELAHGNMGYSILRSQPVHQLILSGVKNTITLMFLSLIITTVIGFALGLIAALKPYSILDYVLAGSSFISAAVPSFFIALILIWIGALNLGWFPTSGLETPGASRSLLDRLSHLVLPLIALSIGGTAGIQRYTRMSMLEVLHEDYVTTARAKGLRERIVVMRHALRNAMLPVITILGLEIPTLFGGTVIIETLFNIPGMGLVMVDAMNTRDYPVIMGGLLISGLLVLFSNLLADIAYAVADPRIRY